MAGGIAQLNANGNEKLDALAKDLAKTQEDLEQARREISSLRDQTTARAGEDRSRRHGAPRASRTTSSGRGRRITDSLDRVKHELDTVNATIEGARTSIREPQRTSSTPRRRRWTT